MINVRDARDIFHTCIASLVALIVLSCVGDNFLILGTMFADEAITASPLFVVLAWRHPSNGYGVLDGATTS